eukprot:17061-Chlamydomonas_euryale.AAC.1
MGGQLIPVALMLPSEGKDCVTAALEAAMWQRGKPCAAEYRVAGGLLALARELATKCAWCRQQLCAKLQTVASHFSVRDAAADRPIAMDALDEVMDADDADATDTASSSDGGVRPNNRWWRASKQPM